MMKHSEKFEHYLDQFRQRMAKLVIAKGMALLATAALLLTVVAIALAARIGFPDTFMVAARLLLVATLAALAWFYMLLPRKRLEQRFDSDVEARTPEFGGRVEAYQNTDKTGNPLRELLAEESLHIASTHSPDIEIPKSEFRNAWSMASASLIVLLLLAIAGPGNYAYGVRDLWVGWAFPGLLPPQSIEVAPGNDGIRFGGNLRIEATPLGFEPRDALINVRFSGNDWQQVEMSGADIHFEFTFFSVRQDLEYFVSADNVRSPSYSVRVVDLPQIENLALTYTFPEWTGLEPEVHDPGGVLHAIKNTIEDYIESSGPF